MPISPEPHQDGSTLRPDFSSAVQTLDGQRLPALAEDRHLFPLLATLARHAGRPDLEDEFLRRASGSSKTSEAVPTDQEKQAKELGRRGLRLLNAQKLDEALEVLRQAIRLNPHAEEAHGNLGVTLARLGKPAEAEAAFRVALLFNPTSSAMYSNLGTTCLQQNQPVEAERAFRQALHFKSEDAEVHRHLGGALEARNLLEAAEAEYRESLRLNPALAETHSRLAGLCRRRDKPKEAEASCREAVRLRPDNVGDWNNLAGPVRRSATLTAGLPGIASQPLVGVVRRRRLWPWLAGVRMALEDAHVGATQVWSAALGWEPVEWPDFVAALRARAWRYPPVHSLCVPGAARQRRADCAGLSSGPGDIAEDVPGH
jgi:Flp pilus assembly protein TadD